MTTPNERFRAIMQTRQFLISLMHADITPNVSQEIRLEAYNLLKHYPTEFYLDELAFHSPDIIQTPNNLIEA
jgi:hypothetical protein